MSAYEIFFSPIAQQQLEQLRVHDHRQILAAIRTNLVHEPLVPTRNRKPLEPTPDALADLARELFLDVDAVWELRVGRWRIAYVVAEQTVYVIWIFSKDRQTTSQALS